jgi:iron complex transport system permease protein
MNEYLSARRQALLLGLGLFLLLLLLLLLGASVGSNGFEPLWNFQDAALARQIVWDIRLPRATGAALAGALLGLSGALAQGLFRNPLADPYLLGSASGASLGLALALLVLSALPAGSVLQPMLFQLGLTGAAFVGAVLAVLLTLTLARGMQHTLRLLLAGVVVGVVLGALSSLTLSLAPELMQTLQAFALGSTAFVDWSACALMAVVLLPCLLLAWGFAAVLDGLSLGEATALSLGLPVARLRTLLLLLMALAAATAVAQTGLIGFVGLAAPHLVRAMLRTTHARLLPLSCLMGAVLLLASDTLARALLAPQELPVGVLTAVLGGAYLLWLMHKQNRAEAGA